MFLIPLYPLGVFFDIRNKTVLNLATYTRCDFENYFVQASGA